jgi:hypothetical protein
VYIVAYLYNSWREDALLYHAVLTVTIYDNNTDRDAFALSFGNFLVSCLNVLQLLHSVDCPVNMMLGTGEARHASQVEPCGATNLMLKTNGAAMLYNDRGAKAELETVGC